MIRSVAKKTHFKRLVCNSALKCPRCFRILYVVNKADCPDNFIY